MKLIVSIEEHDFGLLLTEHDCFSFAHELSCCNDS